MAAIISGSTLAMMFYDHSSGYGNKEGLLTGKVISHIQDTISDSQINNVKVETKIYIYGCTCQSRFESLYDNKGNPCGIDKSAVGWFIYRHNTSHRLSMKEKSVHQKILQNIPPDRKENFLCILCTSQKSENVSTCNFDHTVFKYDSRERKFVAVPLTVINLGDTTHSSYKCSKSCTVDYESGVLGDLLSSFEHELLGPGKKSVETGGVQQMAESLQTQLQCLTHGVMESDMEVYTLQSELEQMELSLHKKMEKKRTMKPLPPSPTTEQPSTSDRLKREQKKKEPTSALYPDLSESKKESSSSSRRRKLSDDNYIVCLDPDSSSTNLHTQIEQKCHILDSPVEAMEDEANHCLNLLVGNSLEPLVSSGKSNAISIDHGDIPFADSEGFDPSANAKNKLDVSDKNKSDASAKNNPDTRSNTSSDPFSFVEGMLANSKSENDVVKKKVNQGKGQEIKSAKVQSIEPSRVTRSKNYQTGIPTRNTQTGNKKKKDGSRSRSREKETNQQKKHNKKTVFDLSSTGSDEDIFDTQEERGNNPREVIDISSSPVF